LVWLLLSPPLWGRPLASDEQVMLLPGTARVIGEGQIEVSVELWVHELERRPGTSTLFARYLGLDLEKMSDDERALFRQRTQLFRVDSERGKNLRVRFADG
jgi:hypothetical protein